jgi:hypothetical protein
MQRGDSASSIARLERGISRKPTYRLLVCKDIGGSSQALRKVDMNIRLPPIREP